MSSKELNFRPPSNYQKIKSAVPGILVFAPIPKVDHSTDAKTYACPQCGAMLAFDLTTSNLGCPYCGFQKSIESQYVGRSAERSEFTLETVAAAQQGWGGMRQELHCENCGAELSYPMGTLAASCPYCASNKVNLHQAMDDKLRPRFLVPFKIPHDQLLPLASQWLGKGWMHPKELASGTVLRQFAGIYLPYWVFDTEIQAVWEAEVGREVSYRVYNRATKSWETRTRIEWEWKNGSRFLKFDGFTVKGTRTKSLNHSLLQAIEPFELSGLVAYQPDFLAGLQAQAYDITLPEAWDHAKMQMRESSKNACRSSINSPHVRNFSMTADFGEESWRYILLPIYLATYRFNDKAFQVIINGQTGKIAGQKPVARWKINLASAAMLLPGFIIGLIYLIMYLMGNEQAGLLCTSILAIIPGIVGTIMVHQSAKKAERG